MVKIASTRLQYDIIIICTQPLSNLQQSLERCTPGTWCGKSGHLVKLTGLQIPVHMLVPAMTVQEMVLFPGWLWLALSLTNCGLYLQALTDKLNQLWDNHRQDKTSGYKEAPWHTHNQISAQKLAAQSNNAFTQNNYFRTVIERTCQSRLRDMANISAQVEKLIMEANSHTHHQQLWSVFVFLSNNGKEIVIPVYQLKVFICFWGIKTL